jgi:hypothetical protein
MLIDNFGIISQVEWRENKTANSRYKIDKIKIFSKE